MTKPDIKNMEAYLILNGYDPVANYTDYDQGPVELPPGYLSHHFKQSEFQCTGSCALCVENSAANLPPQQLLDWLEDIRAHFGGKPVLINSAYRCPSRNAAVGGAKNSQHLTGRAVDIRINGIDPTKVYAYADKLVNEKGGVGHYNTFTHIDTRGYYARW